MTDSHRMSEKLQLRPKMVEYGQKSLSDLRALFLASRSNRENASLNLSELLEI
jgi:DNA repair protein RadC